MRFIDLTPLDKFRGLASRRATARRMLGNVALEAVWSMSYCGAIPNSESESHLLVDACLARVREDAGLDDDPVLPPLHVLIGKPPTPERTRLVVGASAHNLPSAEAIVKSVAKSAATTATVDIPSHASERARAVTRKTQKKSLAQRMRWPVFLCGFLAGIFGGVAVMKSPIGQKPSIQRVAKTVRSHAASAYAATAARIVSR